MELIHPGFDIVRGLALVVIGRVATVPSRLILSRLREKLAGYGDRVRVVLPKLSAAHPELLLIAGMFHHY